MNKPNKINSKNGDLSLIYAYYCRLNPLKMKHKHFDELQQKTQAMDLHQFMTFCKDASLNAKRNKNLANTQQQQVPIQSSSHTQVSKQNGDRKQKIQQTINGQLEMKKNPKSYRMWEDIKSQSNRSQKEVKIKLKPNVYLDQRKIAQIYKHYSSPEGEINFKGFHSVLKAIAQQMYKPKQSQKGQKNPIQKNSKNLSKNNQFIEADAIQLLIEFLKLDTKQNVFEFYKKVNDQHGNLNYLTLLRSPVKKIQVKNDPLGKYAGKQNNEHSRLIEIVNSRKKIIKKNEKILPSLKKDDKNTHIAPLINSKSAYQLPNHTNIQAFLDYHRKQVEMIKKTYEISSKVRANEQLKKQQDQELTLMQNSNVKLKGTEGAKNQKTYSQRHKIKIIGQATKADLGNLIDVSDHLQNDEIFNKYLQINHSPKNRGNKQTLLNSKLHKYK